MIWLTSDTHFGHHRTIELGRSQFRSIDEHDEHLMAAWNAVVGARDTVYHLGDFSFSNKSRRAEVWHGLRGIKHHIEGNHDRDLEKMVSAFPSAGKWLGRLHTFKHEKQRVELCHYPIEVWDRKHYGVWHLHGHSHDHCNTQPTWRRLDVGVDAAKRLLGDYRPFSWDEVKAIMDARLDWSSADHHKPKAGV